VRFISSIVIFLLGVGATCGAYFSGVTQWLPDYMNSHGWGTTAPPYVGGPGVAPLTAPVPAPSAMNSPGPVGPPDAGPPAPAPIEGAPPVGDPGAAPGIAPPAPGFAPESNESEGVPISPPVPPANGPIGPRESEGPPVSSGIAPPPVAPPIGGEPVHDPRSDYGAYRRDADRYDPHRRDGEVFGHGGYIVCDSDGDRCYHASEPFWNYREYYRRHGYHWQSD
jgi:hypothetical protein